MESLYSQDARLPLDHALSEHDRAGSRAWRTEPRWGIGGALSGERGFARWIKWRMLPCVEGTVDAE